MAEIQWGIIGCGDVTEKKSGPAFQKAEGSRLVAVMRRDAARAEDYARRHGVPKYYTDANQLITDPAVNAVYIATPPDAHPGYAVMALDAGKPVYVEKPMARTYAECKRMNQAAARTGLPLFVAYYRRMLPAFTKVKAMIENGAVGVVRCVNTLLCRPAPEMPYEPDSLPWRVNPAIAGGGYFFDVGCHTLDYLDYLFGPITSLHGFATNQADLYPAEDMVSAHYLFKSGVVGTGVWCFGASVNERTDRVEIIGSHGTLVFSVLDQTPIRLRTEFGWQEFEEPWPEHVQLPLVQSVVDQLRGQGECPSTGISASRTARVMDEIIKTWRKNSAETA